MPEYIPKANSSGRLADIIMNTKQNQYAGSESLVNALTNVSDSYFKGKKEEKVAKQKRSEDKEDKMMQLESKLSERALDDVNESKAEFGNNPETGKPYTAKDFEKEPHKLYTAIKENPDWLEAKKKGVTDLAANAPEYMLNTIDNLNDALAKQKDPNAVGQKIDRKSPPTVRVALETLRGLRAGFTETSKGAQAAYAQRPTTELLGDVQQTGSALGEATAQIKPMKLGKEMVEKSKTMKTGQGVPIYDAVKGLPADTKLKDVAIQELIKVTGNEKDAEELYNLIRSAK